MIFDTCSQKLKNGSSLRPHFTQNVSFFPLQNFWHLNPQCNSVFDSTGSGESEWKQGKWNKLDESRWKMVMYRWVCFGENYSMITKFQPFPHSVFRMGVSQVCQFFSVLCVEVLPLSNSASSKVSSLLSLEKNMSR